MTRNTPKFSFDLSELYVDRPLCQAQQQDWTRCRAASLDPDANLAVALRVHLTVDAGALEQALATAVKRHGCLRTALLIAEGIARQRTYRHATFVLDRFAAQGWLTKRLRAEVTAYAHSPFDLKRPPLARVGLFTLTGSDHIWAVAAHPLVMDWHSLLRLLKELAEAMGGGTSLPIKEMDTDYGEAVDAEVRWLVSSQAEATATYWQHRLDGDLAALMLSTDHPRTKQRSLQRAIHVFSLDAPMTLGVKSIASSKQVPVWQVILAAFYALLYRYTSRSDLLVGLVEPATGLALGHLVSTLPVRLKVRSEQSFLSLVADLAAMVAEDLQRYPLSRGRLQASLERRVDGGLASLIRVGFYGAKPGHEPFPDTLHLLLDLLTGAEVHIGPLTASSFPLWACADSFDCSLWVAPTEGSLRLALSFDSDLFEPTTIARMAGHLTTLLEGVIRNPDTAIARLPLLTPMERRQAMEWNNTAVGLPERCIHQVFEAQAARRPEAIAIMCGDQTLTYGDLNERSNRLAHYLVKQEVGPEVLVGIYLERSIDTVICLLAILKSGGAYLNMDPDLPAERVVFMLGDAQVPVLLTRASLRDDLQAHNARVISLEEVETIAREPASNPNVAVNPNNLAYVIYTSGSTGRPKGVLLMHRGVTNMAIAQVRSLGVTEDFRVLQFYSFSFDAAVFETFMALLTGATLVLESRDRLMQGPGLADLLREKRISSIQLPPSVLASLPDADLPDLKNVLVGGEVYLPDLVARWARGRRLFNVYGPTETTVWATLYERRSDRPVLPIGRPICNTRVYILDPDLNLLPIGVPGEIHIGGVGVGRGYLNRPELTMEQFVPDPFSNHPGDRLYRTGDWGRLLPDGNIEFLGRMDNQVKLRGFRVELEEVEAVLLSYPGVREAAAVVRANTDGDRRLISYVVPTSSNHPVSIPALRAFVQEKLPYYMVPSLFMVLDDFPRTPNNKVDKNVLPDPAAHDRETARRPARTVTERTIASIWEEVLDVSGVSVDEHFLDLGGHSLKAVQVIARIRETFGVDFPLSRFFSVPNVSDLTRIVEEALLAEITAMSEEAAAEQLCALPALPAKVDTHSLPSARLRSLTPNRRKLLMMRLAGISRGPVSLTSTAPAGAVAEAPASFAQQRLWLVAQQRPGDITYNIPFSYRLRGPLDREVLRRAMAEIGQRHAVLRSRLLMRDGALYQRVDDRAPLSVVEVDLTSIDPARRTAEALRLLHEAARRPFALARGGLFRGLLLRHDNEDHELVIMVHHAVFDGWSVGILSRELSALYTAYAIGKMPPSGPALQYADFARWQRQWVESLDFARQLAYWQERLRDAPARLPLAAERPRPPARSGAGKRHHFTVVTHTTKALRGLARTHSVTLFNVLLAALKVLLHRYTGGNDLVVGTVSAGRTQRELEDLVGFFVNTLVLRTELTGAENFVEVLERVNHTTLEAQEHQDVPFDKLVEALRPNRLAGDTPLVQVIFVLQSIDISALNIPGLATKLVDVHNGTAKFDLHLELTEAGEELTGWFEYNTDIFSIATVARLADHYQRLLTAVAEHPTAPIGRLPLLSAAERQRTLVEWNSTAAELPRDTFIHRLFEACAARNPNAVAVMFEGQSLTYRELNRRANRLAHRLCQLGMRPDTVVGVSMERSFALVTALLAILKAGGAYVPIDPELPQERRDFMVEDSGVAIILTQDHLRAEVERSGITVIIPDAEQNELAGEPDYDPVVALTMDHLAYLIYTSGSTGKPKGAMNTHRGILNRLLWMQKAFGLGEDDRVLQKTPFSFDVSVWEFFWPLMTGARLVLARPGGHRDPRYLARLITVEHVTTIHFVPSMLRLFLDEPLAAQCSTLRRVICSGEALSLDLQRRFFERLKTGLYNLYGPTEAAIDVSFWKCDPTDDRVVVPIGRPIDNTQLYVLDGALEPVPVGIPGELYIGGVGLARGYINRPQLTAERFIPNSFGPSGSRLYRTGDLARYLEDGNIEFIGRADHQVKLHGLRIELGEIEAILRSHAEIAEAVAIVHGDPSGGGRLVAYVVPIPGRSVPPAAELREFLRRCLPDYMVPSIFVILTELPLTPSGKVNRQALPKPNMAESGTQAEYAAPRTDLERHVATVWEEMLGLSCIGVHDNFFDLGGHSLLATRLTMALRETFGVELPVRSLFEFPTVAGITETIEELRRGGVLLSALENALDLEAEARLTPQIAPHGPFDAARFASPQHVLLTGATGFLGVHLLGELLARTQSTVHVWCGLGTPPMALRASGRHSANTLS
jgi:amino acid adenylation domain-containing protein